MSKQTNIAWTDSTAGPWLICTEVSPGCANCYARELMVNRLKTIARKAFKAAGFKDWETRPVWGKTAPRILTRDFRGKMLAMNKKPWICEACGNATPNEPVYCGKCGFKSGSHRRRSFPSLIDWLDDMPAGIIDQDGNKLDPISVLADFLDTLRLCDQMVHILCSKRPENWRERLAVSICETESAATRNWIAGWLDASNPPKNVVILASVENQAMADKRIPELLKIPAACRGLSLEPLLSSVDLSKWIGSGGLHSSETQPKISWQIIGGESGPQARPCDARWIRSLIEQGQSAGIAVFVKQFGSNQIHFGPTGEQDFKTKLKDKKGADPFEWPVGFRIQQWPKGF